MPYGYVFAQISVTDPDGLAEANEALRRDR